MPDEKDSKLSLDAAIAKAESETPVENPEEEPTKVEKKEDKKEEKKEHKENEEHVAEDPFADLTDADILNAKAIYKALKQPDSQEGKYVINKIIELAQVDIDKDSSKKEVKEAAKSIKDVIKEELGEDYKFLADKLGSALEKGLEKAVTERTKDIRDDITFRQQKELENTLKSAQDRLQENYPQVKDLETEMVKIMDQIKPSPNTPPYEYIESILFIAANRKGINLKTKTSSNQRIESNRKDAHSRLASEGVEPTKVATTSRKQNLDESIKAAMEKVAAESK